MSDTPSLRTNTFWAACGQVSSIVLQTIYFILISRMLGSYEYGLFIGVYSLVAVLSPYSTLGFGMIMLRDSSRDPSRLGRTWGMSLTVLVGGTIAVMTIAAVSSRFSIYVTP